VKARNSQKKNGPEETYSQEPDHQARREQLQGGVTHVLQVGDETCPEQRHRKDQDRQPPPRAPDAGGP
jgi:hypothetical protein